MNAYEHTNYVHAAREHTNVHAAHEHTNVHAARDHTNVHAAREHTNVPASYEHTNVPAARERINVPAACEHTTAHAACEQVNVHACEHTSVQDVNVDDVFPLDVAFIVDCGMFLTLDTCRSRLDRQPTTSVMGPWIAPSRGWCPRHIRASHIQGRVCWILWRPDYPPTTDILWR